MAGYYSSPLPLSSSLPGFAARVLINTAALARCQGRLSEPQLFQQFVPRRCQPLKRLRATRLLLRPTEATVPMHANSLPVETSGPALRSHTALVAGEDWTGQSARLFLKLCAAMRIKGASIGLYEKAVPATRAGQDFWA